MKKVIVFILLAFCSIISLTSCGGENKKKNNAPAESNNKIKEQPKLESVFKINLNMVIPNDDTIEVFYLDYDDTNYSYKTKVTKKVIGSSKAQNIEVLLPKEIFPNSLRIDFGLNRSEEDVVLNSVAMTYEDFSMVLTAEEFHAFFMPNKYINYIKETGVVERKVVDGKYDPYFNARAVLRKKLELEAR
jgi:hypothetical protein